MRQEAVRCCKSTALSAPLRLELVVSETVKISEDERKALATGESSEFPKYTTQILNIANQNAQGTRPKVVGSMNSIIEEFQEEYPEGGFEDWAQFYREAHDGEDRLEEATERVTDMIHKMAEAMDKIDRGMVREWIEDLVLWKTFQGFDVQRVVLRKLADRIGVSYELGGPEDESKGIDGYLGDQPVSIKPATYQEKPHLREDIEAPIVFYEEYASSKALRVFTEELSDVFPAL